MRRFRTVLLLTLTLSLLFASPLFYRATRADGGANHQTRNLHFGVSGGNVNDSSRLFCCSGTLGSLVTDGTTQYILSNNHVLARSDQAIAGEDVSQPGLIDNGCRIPPHVADFTVAPRLGSNVDAAIAQLIAGTMDPTGFIEDIGTISSSVRAPAVGLAVRKSGRTTGHTTGTVSSINTNVSVQYQAGCGKGKKFTVSYTNQVVINSSTFSAGGDSGSLIVSNDASCAQPQPVALLYAGSSTSTIGNPIGEVLTKVSAALGRPISFVGAAICGTSSLTGSATPGEGATVSRLPQQAIEHAKGVKNANVDVLMTLPSVIGVGVGASDVAGEAAIIVYVDRTTGVRPKLPARLEGVAVKEVLTDTFVAR